MVTLLHTDHYCLQPRWFLLRTYNHVQDSWSLASTASTHYLMADDDEPDFMAIFAVVSSSIIGASRDANSHIKQQRQRFNMHRPWLLTYHPCPMLSNMLDRNYIYWKQPFPTITTVAMTTIQHRHLKCVTNDRRIVIGIGMPHGRSRIGWGMIQSVSNGPWGHCNCNHRKKNIENCIKQVWEVFCKK